MFENPRRLRAPEERVGKCSNAALPPPDASDFEDALVCRIRSGDEAAVRSLYERYAQALQHFALQFLHRPEDAEEVVQETWMAALAGIDGFQGRSSFKTWLFSILVNRARTRAKRDARAIPFSGLSHAERSQVENTAAHLPVTDRFHAPPQPADHLTLTTELQSVLLRAIGSLPEIQRLVITLRDVEGWSASEACETLGISHSNQRVSLHRARMKVRADVMPYLLTGARAQSV